MQAYHVRVVEPLTNDSFGPETTAAMKLPFDKGWDWWGVFDADGTQIELWSDYDEAVLACGFYNLPMLSGSHYHVHAHT